MYLDSGNQDFASAMETAMRWLAVRGRSRTEIEARLRNAGFPEEVARGVAHRLTEIGILSDRDLALAGVESGLRRGLSRSNIQQQLEGQGISPADVAWALEESGNQQRDAERAEQLAASWVRRHPREGGTRAFRRLAGLLVRKGYDEELVGEVCRSVLGDPPRRGRGEKAPGRELIDPSRGRT